MTKADSVRTLGSETDSGANSLSECEVALNSR
jgi:hypothetical protein